jgi:Lon protease-like protein
MIARCLDKKEEFGVVLARGKGIAEIGCSTEIVNVVKKYDDGRLDILTAGRRRFRVVELFEGLPYLQGRVDFFSEQEGVEGAGAASERLWSLFQEALGLLADRPRRSSQRASGSFLSFSVATVLPLDLDYKQSLLELPSEAERQQSLVAHLEAWILRQRRLRKVGSKSKGNGFAR